MEGCVSALTFHLESLERPLTYPRLVAAGTHSGVGTTTVTLALLPALKARDPRVQVFMAG